MMSRCKPHIPLTCARALYIGRAAPQASHDGLDAVQKPLSELYNKSDRQSKLDDHDATVHIFTSGILMKPVNPLDKDIWLRIQDLESCAAVKPYNDPAYCGQLIFAPVDTRAGRASPHPAIFTVVMKRSAGGIKISDCYAFICHTDETALILVQATTQAFSDKSGWTSERPSLIELGLEKEEEKLDNECYVDDARDDCAPEFYEKPKLSGFFYAPRSDLIQKYNIHGEDDFGRPTDDGSALIEHFTCEQPTEPPAQQHPAICGQPGMQQITYPQGQQMMVYGGQQQMGHHIVPEQAQLYHGSNQVEAWQERNAYKMDKKARKEEKKRNKQMNLYVENEGNQGAIREFANSGGQYPSGGNDAPIYMRHLPHEDAIMAENRRRGLENVLPIRMAEVGMGDNGPPAGDMDLYSRRLPTRESSQGGRNFDANFILRKSDAYQPGRSGGYNVGNLGIGDVY
jgi:hypothetical protein